MSHYVQAGNYIRIGQGVEHLRLAKAGPLDAFKTALAGLLQELENAKFTATHSALRILSEAPLSADNGFVPPSLYGQIDTAIAAVAATLASEAAERLLRKVDLHSASPKLRGLPTALALTPTQQHLLDEVVLCLESGAYRSATVMAWNLCYERIRWVIWDDVPKRAAFNAIIQAITDRRGALVYPLGVVNYEDFYTLRPVLGERDVLNAAKDAGLLSGVYDTLTQRLRERNTFAHANSTQPSLYQANYYIESLVDIVTSAPFV